MTSGFAKPFRMSAREFQSRRGSGTVMVSPVQLAFTITCLLNGFLASTSPPASTGTRGSLRPG